MKWLRSHEAENLVSNMQFRHFTAWFILLAPVAILLTDFLVYRLFGYDATITGVIRSWAAQSTWPLFIYVVGVVVLGLHLFTGWPD